MFGMCMHACLYMCLCLSMCLCFHVMCITQMCIFIKNRLFFHTLYPDYTPSTQLDSVEFLPTSPPLQAHFLFVSLEKSPFLRDNS